jgi:two-component system, NarL family, invasion response regulator UvrY
MPSNLLPTLNTMASMKLSILVVDDHAIVREGLKSILAKAENLTVIGEAGNAPDAMALLRKQPCDLVLLDISLPGKTGVDLLKMIHDELPKVRVLVLSTYPEDQYAVRVLKLGASGYLTKESAPELLIQAIRKVAGGGKYVSPAMAERLLDEIGSDGQHAPHELLSDKEFEVFKLIAMGKSLTDIADGMHVSIKTISTHRTRILEKTGFKANADFTRYALQHGLIE